MNQTTEFDAIVIGSGITGGWAAKELTAKGLKVLVLERGKPLEHQKGYVHEFTPPWQAPMHGLPDRALDARDYEIQSRIEETWAARTDRYSESRATLRGAADLHKVEMNYIGG